MAWIVQTKASDSRFWQTRPGIYPSYEEAQQVGQAIDGSQLVRYRNVENGKTLARIPGQFV